MKVERSHIIVLIFISLVLFLSLSYLSQKNRSEQKNFIYSMPNFASDSFILFPLEKNYTSLPENVNLKVVSLASTNKMLISGKSDMGRMSTSAYFISQAKGQRDLKIDLIATKDKTIGIFARKGSDIDSYKDLKNKTIAVFGLKSTTTNIMLDLMKRKGIGRKNLNLVSKKPFQIPELIRKGEVDAGALVGYSYLKGLKDFKLVLDLPQEFKNVYGFYPITGVCVSEPGVSEDIRRDTFEALNNSFEYGRNYPENASRFYQKQYQSGVNVTDFLYKISTENIIEYYEEPKKLEIKTMKKLFEETYNMKLPPAEDMLFD